jgi:hypothetical protein
MLCTLFTNVNAGRLNTTWRAARWTPPDPDTESVNLTFCSPCIMAIDNNQPTTALNVIILTL